MKNVSFYIKGGLLTVIDFFITHGTFLISWLETLCHA